MFFDASVAVKLVLDEPDSPAARALFERHLGTVGAPSLLALEVANAIRFTRRLPSAAAKAEALVRFQGIGIVLVPPSAADVQDALAFALEHETSTYDALYAVMARAAGTRVATADARFAARARVPDVVLLRDWQP